MRILHMALKKRWFDLIACGEKKEEYREIKPHWNQRLLAWPHRYAASLEVVKSIPPPLRFNSFDAVEFKNGYRPDSPTVTVECKGISIGKPAFKWYGAEPKEDVFIIHLGEIITPPQQ